MITTLRLFSLNRLPIETSTAWYLNDLGEYRGKQELYTQQSPQRLKALRESAIIESAVSSNRIEGVTIDPWFYGWYSSVFLPAGDRFPGSFCYQQEIEEAKLNSSTMPVQNCFWLAEKQIASP